MTDMGLPVSWIKHKTCQECIDVESKETCKDTCG